jgi:hypothetical protein
MILSNNNNNTHGNHVTCPGSTNITLAPPPAPSDRPILAKQILKALNTASLNDQFIPLVVAYFLYLLCDGGIICIYCSLSFLVMYGSFLFHQKILLISHLEGLMGRSTRMI